MSEYAKILEFINGSPYLFTDYILAQLKKIETLNLISEIIDRSNRKIPEAVSLVIYSIKFLSNDPGVLSKLEETDSFEEYVKANRKPIIELSLKSKNQANLPQRAFPLFEIFNRKIPGSSAAVIELGASYGLIGRCLLEPSRIIKNKHRYFPPNQQFPLNPRSIDYYLGIDLVLPGKDWILASTWTPDEEKRLRNFIDDIQPTDKFQRLKGNAIGFSTLEAVKKLAQQPFIVVVLTSFMLYQLDRQTQTQLKNEILAFIERTGSHWVNQAVDTTLSTSTNEYFIEWDGQKIIELSDGRCTSWRWR